jgi:uncharacterized protein (TIGR02231 family)
MTSSSNPPSLARLFPPLESEQRTVVVPVKKVTLLEDRAQVLREATVSLQAGRNRLVVMDVAPVIYDVSLRGSVSGIDAQLVDVRAQRAMRIAYHEKPEKISEIEKKLEDLFQEFVEVSEDRQQAETRYRAVIEILRKGLHEISDDAGWGLINHQVWNETFESLFRKARTLQNSMLDHYFTQIDVSEKASALINKRRAFDRPDTRFVAWLAADIDASQAGDVQLCFEYIVPNALWRPSHSATLLADSQLSFRCSATVWQNTGEDWNDVEMVFSTARSSLGVDPPLLADDLLNAQVKSEGVVVEQRQVAVQKTGVNSSASGAEAPSSSNVDLPGVDDGGEIQNLIATHRSTIVSDGRPNLIPIFDFQTQAKVSLVCMPELDERVFSKSVQKNDGKFPILAGPVELIRDNGFVGWTKVLFVAPGEAFELGFGPDDAIRILRTQQRDANTSHTDKWRHQDTKTQVYVSNLADESKIVELTERIPVSEIEQVKVGIRNDKSNPNPETIDDNGFCHWNLKLDPHSQQELVFVWRLSSAPNVRLT